MSADRRPLDPIRDLARALGELADLPTRMHTDRPRSQGGRSLDVLGGLGCWCGLPSGHEWPGKGKGRPHPAVDD